MANADDPLVAWAALASTEVTWVAAGQPWHGDAVGCPSCGGRLLREGSAWWCGDGCGLSRPSPQAWLEDGSLVTRGRRVPLALALPGQFNLANGAMAALAGEALGCDLSAAVSALSGIGAVAGRYERRRLVMEDGQVALVRLLLAKNPAGFSELLGLLSPGANPLVLGINARVADGQDTSWLWDVPFERIADRTVVATGERWRDLAVRLRYAGVHHVGTPDVMRAVAMALRCGSPEPGGPEGTKVDVASNYTAFQVARRRLVSSAAELP